jgi:DNA-binding XRE family transcriptional regulator
MEIKTIKQDGRERVVMDRAVYENLVNTRDHAQAMRDVATGAATLTEAEVRAYLAAPTQLAFWRKRSGKSQAALAAEAGILQPFLAQIESAKREGSVAVLAKIARALDVRIEDLISD